MALETGNYISDLVATNPTSADNKKEGDNHIRLMKTALKTCFAGFGGAVVLTGSDTGGVNNYALTPTPALPGYVTGMMVIMTPSATNTTGSTINISSLGAKTIKRVDGNAVTSGDLVAGSYAIMVYDGTDFLLLSPTKNYIDQLSFTSSLPSQTGNGGKYLTTDGSNASWANPYADAALTGTPTTPTASVDTNTTQIASTAFVIGQAYAKLASPALTGTPTAPTGAADITTSQIITAAWYSGQAGTAAPQMNGSAVSGTSKKWTPIDHVHPTDTTKAPLASPTFTGTPAGPTAAPDTNTTQLATTAFVIGQAYAKLASPALTGTPTAPTASPSTNNTQIATTAYADAAVAALTIPGEATQANIESETGTTAFLSPAKARFAPGAAKMWVKCTTTTIAASYNVTSIVNFNANDITVNIADDFSSVNYAVVGTCENDNSLWLITASQAVGSFQMNGGGSTINYFLAAFGDQ